MWLCCRYDKFSFDITDAVEGHADGHKHELLVQVFDPTGATLLPKPHYCAFATLVTSTTCCAQYIPALAMSLTDW